MKGIFTMKTNLKFKKFTSLLLTFLMILSMGTFSALAEDTYSVTYTAKQLIEGGLLTDSIYAASDYGDKVEPWGSNAVVLRANAGGHLTFDFDGEPGVYSVSIKAKVGSDAVSCNFSVVNNTLYETVSGVATDTSALGTYKTASFTADGTLEIFNGDSITVKPTSKLFYLASITFMRVGEAGPEKVVAYADAADYMNESGEGIDYSKEPEANGGGTLIRGTNWANYEVVAPEAGLYDVTVTYKGGTNWVNLVSNTTAQSIRGIMSNTNDAFLGNSTWTGTAGAPAIQMYLNKGTNIIKVRMESNNGWFLGFKFTKAKADEPATVYQYATGYSDGGLYDVNNSATIINSSEAKALLLRSTGVIGIGGKTFNETKYASFVKYNITAPETGIYKVTLNLGNYGGEWINALKNETLGISEKGIVPKSTTLSPVSTWSLTEGGEYVDITIPMVKGENVISFSKISSDIWFDKIVFTKVDEYIPEEPEEPTPDDPEDPTPDDPEDSTKIKISVNAQDYIPGGVDVSYSAAVTNDGTNGILIGGNNWVRYAIYAPEAGLYDVTLNYKSGMEWYVLTNETLPIKKNVSGILSSSNGQYIDATTWTVNNATSAIQIYLNEGTNFIKLTKQYNQGYLGKMTFTKTKQGPTVYKNALDYYEGGLYDADGLEITTEEAKALLISNTNYIKIGKKTLNNTNYHSFVKYKVNAPETGVYKVSLRMGNYGSEWINALTNETLNVTNKGIVPASTTVSFVDTWSLTEGGEYVDITIPMLRGENIITLKKLQSDIWFDNILFTKVDDYTAVSYTAEQMYNNATDMFYDKYGVQYVNCFTMRGANGHYITLKYTGTSGKYNIGVKGATDAAGCEFSLINETTGKSVGAALNTGALDTTDWATAKGLDINSGDLITIKYTKGVMFLTNIKFTEVGDVTIEAEVGYAATDAEHTNALTVDGALSMPEGAFAEFNINSDDCLYLAATAINAEVDSLIKLTVGSESIYEFIKAGSEESYSLINMPQGAEKAIVSVEKGAISLYEIGLYHDNDTATYSEAISAFASAKTADGVKEALSGVSHIDVIGDLNGIFYSESVINSLKQNVYTDITALLSDYSAVVYNERTNPSIILKNKDGNAVEALEAGAMSLDVKADWLEDTMSIYLAIYDGNKLVAVDTKDYDENGITLNVTIPETGSYTYEIFVWENMTPYCL